MRVVIVAIVVLSVTQSLSVKANHSECTLAPVAYSGSPLTLTLPPPRANQHRVDVDHFRTDPDLRVKKIVGGIGRRLVCSFSARDLIPRAPKLHQAPMSN